MRLQPPCHVHANHCFPHYDADLSKLGWVVIVAGSVVQTWLSCAWRRSRFTHGEQDVSKPLIDPASDGISSIRQSSTRGWPPGHAHAALPLCRLASMPT